MRISVRQAIPPHVRIAWCVSGSQAPVHTVFIFYVRPWLRCWRRCLFRSILALLEKKTACVTAFGVNRTLWTEPESSSLGSLLFFEKECISKITKMRLCLIDLQAKEFTIVYKSCRRHTFARSLKSFCSVAQKPVLWSLAWLSVRISFMSRLIRTFFPWAVQ